MINITDTLGKIKGSELVAALLSFIKGAFSFTKATDRTEYKWTLPWIILFSVILANTHHQVVYLLWTLLVIATISLTIRRANDSGFRWYISLCPIIMLLLSILAIAVVSYSKLSAVASKVGGRANLAFIGNYSDSTVSLLLTLAITSAVIFVITLLLVIVRVRRYFQDKKLTKIIYVTSALLFCLSSVAAFTIYFNNMYNAVDDSSYKYSIPENPTSDSISKFIIVNGVFNSGIDTETSESVISYYEGNKNSFKDNFSKFSTEENKIDEDIYSLPVFAQNVSEESNTYPLIEVGVLNTSNETKELKIQSCKINDKYVELATVQKLEPGVNFIPVKLKSLDKLSGNESFSIVFNDSVLTYSTLYNLESYNSD